MIVDTVNVKHNKTKVDFINNDYFIFCQIRFLKTYKFQKN